jgi:hypothetical protein
MFQKIDTGNRNNSYEKCACCVDLPFAGITLFRFNGFFLSFLQHPEDAAKIGRKMIQSAVTLC